MIRGALEGQEMAQEHVFRKTMLLTCKSRYIVVTVDATHRPVEFSHLHAGMADYFYRGGQRFQNFGLQPTKWLKLSVSL